MNALLCGARRAAVSPGSVRMPAFRCTTLGPREDGWEVESLTHAQFGPFRRLYLTPAETRERYAGLGLAAGQLSRGWRAPGLLGQVLLGAGTLAAVAASWFLAFR